MKVHYFQRYHAKENVATANSMLLISRLYSFSPDKFYQFLKNMFSDDFNPEVEFEMQKSNGVSIPDAVISQPSFKIVIETKLSTSGFDYDQLIRHLKSFKDENYKVLISLAPEVMNDKTLEKVKSKIDEYNKTKNCIPRIIHINTTFYDLANYVKETLHDHDYEMHNIVEDYLDYCNNDGLIPVDYSWKYMKMQLVKDTIEFNIKEGIYYHGANRGFMPHDYIGLYDNKSIRAIGKVTAIVTAVESNGVLEFNTEKGLLTDEIKEKIKFAIKDAEKYQYDLHNFEHRYFIVDKFYPTDYKKVSANGSRGSKIFDLTEIFGSDELPNVAEMAEKLKTLTWT